MPRPEPGDPLGDESSRHTQIARAEFKRTANWTKRGVGRSATPQSRERPADQPEVRCPATRQVPGGELLKVWKS
jgi:hypothetical protein